MSSTDDHINPLHPFARAVHDRMAAATALLEESLLSPEAAWLTDFMEVLAPIAALHAQPNRPPAPDSDDDKAIIGQLFADFGGLFSAIRMVYDYAYRPERLKPLVYWAANTGVFLLWRSYTQPSPGLPPLSPRLLTEPIVLSPGQEGPILANFDESCEPGDLIPLLRELIRDTAPSL